MSEKIIKDEIKYLKEVFNKLLDVLERMSSEVTSLEDRLARIELKLEELSINLKKAPSIPAPSAMPETEKSVAPVEKPVEKLVEKPATEQPIFGEVEKTETAKVEEIGELEEIPAEIPSPEAPEQVSEVPMPEELPPEEEVPVSMDAATIQQKISEYEEELVSIERQISDLEFNYEGGFLDQREYKAQMSELQKKKEDLRRKIAELRKRLE